LAVRRETFSSVISLNEGCHAGAGGYDTLRVYLCVQCLYRWALYSVCIVPYSACMCVYRCLLYLGRCLPGPGPEGCGAAFRRLSRRGVSMSMAARGDTPYAGTGWSYRSTPLQPPCTSLPEYSTRAQRVWARRDAARLCRREMSMAARGDTPRRQACHLQRDKPAIYSETSLPFAARQACHLQRDKPAICSETSLPFTARQACHLQRDKPAICSERCGAACRREMSMAAHGDTPRRQACHLQRDKPAIYSETSLPFTARQACHLQRDKPAIYSETSLPFTARQACHLQRDKPAIYSETSLPFTARDAARLVDVHVCTRRYTPPSTARWLLASARRRRQPGAGPECVPRAGRREERPGTRDKLAPATSRGISRTHAARHLPGLSEALGDAVRPDAARRGGCIAACGLI
jgi:hypothetical protein